MRTLALLFVSVLAVQFALAQCPNNNTYWETVAAPSYVGNSVSTLLYGGEYTTVTGMQAGYVYEITTCGDNAFDSQITIYRASNGTLEAFNDDYSTCTPQSRIFFSPFVSGSYNIVLDEYNCDVSSDYIEVEIRKYDSIYPVVTIPTVVHVVYNNSTENISTSQIQSQIDVLNEDFRRLNSDIANAPSRFRGYSKDVRIEFCLATQDPDGNPTDGITRTSTTSTSFVQDDAMKFTNSGGKDAWDRDDYLNIWVCDLAGSTLGYAQFPGTGSASTDGVVIDYQYFGTTGTATSPFDLGRTATHEVGHWLDLFHIWGDDNGACSGSDEIQDTPNQGGSSYGCPSSPPVSCSNAYLGGDMYVNYMDYSNDECLHMFTYWQYRRMEATLYSDRVSLLSSVGCESGNPPVAAFTASTTQTSTGSSITFTDQSTSNPQTWLWTFQGGSPSTSNAQSPPSITYNTPGTYSVTLEVSNGWGTDTEIKTGYITVGDPPEADFEADVVFGPAPHSVNFTDLTINNATSWNWSFPGASPSNSTTQNPTGITYSTAGLYSATLTAYNAFGSSTVTKAEYIEVDFPTAAENLSDDIQFEVYPNPNPGQFTLILNSAELTESKVKVIDHLGRQVFEQALEGQSRLDIDLKHLDSGFYTIQVGGGDQSMTRKLIIQR